MPGQRSVEQSDIWSTLDVALETALSQVLVSEAELSGLIALSGCAADQPAEPYAIALTLTRLHEARDSFSRLASLNERFLEIEANADAPLQGSARYAIWQLVLAEGRVLAALHGDADVAHAEKFYDAHIECLVAATAADKTLQRWRLRGLITALAYGQFRGDTALRLRIDACAAECLQHFDETPYDIGRWWAERAAIEISNFNVEYLIESPISGLLQKTDEALLACPDPITRFKAGRNQFDWARALKDVPRAQANLEVLRAAQISLGTGHRAFGLVLLRKKAELAAMQCDMVLSERFIREAIALAETIVAAKNQMTMLWSALIAPLLQQGRYAAAALAAESALHYAIAQHRGLIEMLAGLCNARAQWSDSFSRAVEHLRESMRSASATKYVQFLRADPELAGWFCSKAIDHEIEPAFVAEVITRRALTPPLDAGEFWPWAVRVRLLGGFSVEGAGVDLVSGAKAQQRTLEIIQLLAIAGRKGIDRPNLARAIYGSALLDSPATLNMALSRARRLLGDDSLIDTHGSRIRLDSRRVYVDLWALEALQPASGDEARWQCGRLLSIYQGALLEGSAAATTHRMAVATYRDRFVSLAIALAAKLAAPEAIAFLREACKRERGAEALYRALIERLAEDGEAAEAIEVFQQCEAVLRQTYGVAPSERTQRLVDGIRKKSLDGSGGKFHGKKTTP